MLLDKSGGSLRVQDVAHGDSRQGYRRRHRVEHHPGLAPEQLAVRPVAGRSRRQVVQHAVGKNKFDRVECLHECGEDLSLLATRDFLHRRLSVSTQRVAVVDTAQSGCGRLDLVPVVQVERNQYLLHRRQRHA